METNRSTTGSSRMVLILAKEGRMVPGREASVYMQCVYVCSSVRMVVCDDTWTIIKSIKSVGHRLWRFNRISSTCGFHAGRQPGGQ